jgi:hypothetical protein
LIVSQALTNYSKTGEELNISNIIIPLQDGKTRETAGISAFQIKNSTCTNENGIYWIKNPDTGIAKQIYCIMDSACDGGGWMLAMKGSNNTGVFSYSGSEDIQNGINTNPKLSQRYNIINHWETNSVLNEDDVDYNSGKDAKYDIFNYFRVTSCLAIFDKKDTGYENLLNYGWVWIDTIANGNRPPMSLKDYFATSKSQIYYYSSGNYDFVTGYNNRNPQKPYDSRYVFKFTKNSFNEYIIKKTYNNKIWSRQEEFQAFGFNVIPFGWNHKVRWGGTFNENYGGIPDSNDVSGGIGVSASNWNAGNTPTCCESSPGVAKKQMGFKWFIR